MLTLFACSGDNSSSESQAFLLFERLLIGQYRGRHILIVGRSGTGKASFVHCLFKVTYAKVAIQPDTEQDPIGVTINIYTPRKETKKHIKEPVDVILLCIRLDDQLRAEDQETIIHLAKKFGKEFLKKTVIMLTMANKVKPMGALRHQHSDHQYLKTVRDEFNDVIIDTLKKHKVMLLLQISHKFVLAGAPELLPDDRMIPNVEGCDDSWIDWIPPVVHALLDLDSMHSA